MNAAIKKTLQGIGMIVALFILGGVLLVLEPPVGSIVGKVVDNDGKPLANAKVSLDSYPTDRATRSNELGEFRFDNLPIKSFYVRVQSKGYQYQYLQGTYPVQEGKETVVGPVVMLRLDPSLRLELWDSVKRIDQKVKATLSGARVKSVDLKLYKVDLMQVLAQNKQVSDLEGDTLDPKTLDGLALVKEWTEEIPEADVWEFDQKISIPADGAGLFMIHAEASSMDRKQAFTRNIILNKTDLGFLAKRDADKLLVYASSFTKPHPLEGAQFKVIYPDGKTFEANTNNQGVAEFAIPAKDYADVPWIIGQFQGSLGYLQAPSEVLDESSYDEGAGEGEGQDSEDGAAPVADYRNVTTFLYTERPIYRPGQKVYFKGIARQAKTSGGYEAAPPFTAQVRVENPKGDTVYEGELKGNEYGSFWGDFDLAEEAEIGYYSLIANLPGKEFRSDFSVEEYRKPEFKVDVRPDKPRFYTGDKVTYMIDVQYYFGAPVDAALEYSLYKSPYYYQDPSEAYVNYDYHEEEYAGGYGEFIEEGKMKTDANGHATFTYTPKEGEEDMRYTLRVTAKDMTEKIVTREGDAFVVGGDFFFRTRRQEFLAFSGKSFPLIVVTKDYDGKPVSRDFELKVEREYWDRVAGVYDYNKVEKLSGKTGADGLAQMPINFKEGGYYRLAFSGKDSAGRKVIFYDYIWVAGKTDQEEGYGLDRSFIVIPEKKNYNAGDTAKLLVVSSEKDAYVLVSVEGTRIHDFRVEKVDGFSKLIEVPLKKEWAPNVFVSVSSIGEKSLSEEFVELNVNPSDNYLTVDIQPDPKSFQPGEDVAYLVTTKNIQGQPVPAEISLGVVDESIYALRADSTDIKNFFWGPKPNRVGTASSFSGYYSGGIEKEDRNLLRRNFKDTAFWAPSVVTDAQGQATVKFKLPDNLTTWRTTVVASTLGTDVGQQTNQVISNKPIMVRLATPRFFMQRDVLSLKAVIHNYTDKAQTVNVSLGMSGLEFQNPGDDKPRTLTIESKKTASFDFTVLAKLPGEAKLQLLAKNNEYNDGLELKIPVLAHGIEEHHYAQGQTAGAQPGGQGQSKVGLVLPPSTVPEVSNLKVTLDATFVAQLIGSLVYLVDYPYGCVEQTTSRILPAVAVSDLYKSLGLSDPLLEKRIPKVIDKGIKRLVKFQHDDGGWGWWATDETDPYMTSYAMYGLLRIQSLGHPIPEHVLQKGKESLQKQLQEGAQARSATSPYGQEIPYFIHYVASLAGIPNNPPMPGDKPVPSKLAQALLILALEAQGKHDLALPLLTDLERSAICSGGMCHFSNGTNAYRGDGEVTGWALHALMKGGSTNSVLKDSVVKWLLSVRKGGMWRHTQETASVLTGLTEYARDLPGAKSGVHAKLVLNGTDLETIRVGSPHFVRNLPHPTLKVGSNELGIFNYLPTTLYYQADLQYFTQEENLQAVSNGIQVRREYVRIKSEIQNDEKIYKTEPLKGKIKRGESIGVRVTLQTTQDLSYLVIEDPLPSGFEVQDQFNFDSNTSYFAELTVRDEKVALFQNYLGTGTYVFNYVIRPELPGQFHVMPSHSYEMYRPEVGGMSAEMRLEVE